MPHMERFYSSRQQAALSHHEVKVSAFVQDSSQKIRSVSSASLSIIILILVHSSVV